MGAKKTRKISDELRDTVRKNPPGLTKKGRRTDAEIIEGARKRGQLRGMSTKRRRSDSEMGRVRYLSTLKLDIISAEALKIHAIQRRVSQAALIADILNCWIKIATDYNQALFRELLPPGARAAEAPERWQGYLASLGFARALSVKQNELPQGDTGPLPGVQAPVGPRRHDVSPPVDVVPTQEAPLTPPPDPASIQNRSSEAYGTDNPRENRQTAREKPPEPRGDAKIRGFEPLPDEELLAKRTAQPTAADFPLPNSGASVPRETLPEHMRKRYQHPIATAPDEPVPDRPLTPAGRPQGTRRTPVRPGPQADPTKGTP